jgi:hypothetical protein
MADEPQEGLSYYKDKLWKYPKKGVELYTVKLDDDNWIVYEQEPKNDHEVYQTASGLIYDPNPRKRRMKLGAWLADKRPDEAEDMVAQVFIDQLNPLPFDEIFDDIEDTPEGGALLEAVDMAISVINEGGSCTNCGVEPDADRYIRHTRGCIVPSYLMWRLLNPEDQDRSPSLAQVVQAAKDQIAKMA